MNKSNYFSGINLLRVLACLLIVSFHYYPAAGGGFFTKVPLINLLVANGNLMVNLFFMISGFCIAANYKNKLMNGMTFKSYFIKHYLKFVSLSLLTIPISVIKQAAVYKATLDMTHITFTDIIKDILCIRYGWFPNSTMPYNGSLWFVNILLIMYLMYFFCCKISNHYVEICVLFVLLGFLLKSNDVIVLPFFNKFAASGYYNFFCRNTII